MTEDKIEVDKVVSEANTSDITALEETIRKVLKENINSLSKKSLVDDVEQEQKQKNEQKNAIKNIEKQVALNSELSNFCASLGEKYSSLSAKRNAEKDDVGYELTNKQLKKDIIELFYRDAKIDSFNNMLSETKTKIENYLNDENSEFSTNDIFDLIKVNVEFRDKQKKFMNKHLPSDAGGDADSLIALQSKTSAVLINNL